MTIINKKEYYQTPLNALQLREFDNSTEVLHAKRFRTIREDIYFDSLNTHPNTYRKTF